MKKNIIILRDLGLQHWLYTFQKMHDFTNNRNINTLDEIWYVEHYPIFTEGCIHKKENIIFLNNIPIVKTDRGGQITYHGPGQQIIYFLINLQRRKIGIRQLINIMQNIIIDTLDSFLIHAYAKKEFPGVYVDQKKISSLGLRIKNGSTLHGIALNIDMDLTPFNYIHPCGDKNIIMTQMKDINKNIKIKEVKILLMQTLSYYFQVDIININTLTI
ncbi:lipoyl(octanoyl) transferase LipB [Buchnera aphidicola]|uniref:lipoyl(octanoyl) transferase LipB n=1 Tax=Buchnera aphidicola TaxID=9 RepID=UPI003BEF1473